MGRTIACFLIAAVSLVGCGEATDQPGAQTSTTAETVSTLPDQANTYHYLVTFVATSVDGSRRVFELAGAVDEDRGIAELRYTPPGDSAVGVETIIVQTDERTAVFAPQPDMVPSHAIDDLDSRQWFDLDVFTSNGPDAFVLSSTPSATSLWQLLGVTPQPTDRDGALIEVAVVGQESVAPHWGMNTVLDFIGRSVERLEIVTETHEDGLLREIQFRSLGDGEDGHLTITITDRGGPVDIEFPESLIQVPLQKVQPPTIPIGPITTTPPPRIEPDTEGVLFRLSITGGWQLPEPPARRISLEADGSLVRAINPNVYASTESFMVMRLSPKGVERIAALVEESGLLGKRHLVDGGEGVSPTDVSATLWLGGSAWLNMDRIGETNGFTEPEQEARAAFEEIIAKLDDPYWLGEDILSDWEPWVPERLTVLAGDVSARSGLPTGSPFVDWPLSAGIEELASTTTTNAYDEIELALCLEGDQVGPVWALLTGVNNAYLRVDDGRRWELTYLLSTPGYRLYSDPC